MVELHLKVQVSETLTRNSAVRSSLGTSDHSLLTEEGLVKTIDLCPAPIVFTGGTRQRAVRRSNESTTAWPFSMRPPADTLRHRASTHRIAFVIMALFHWLALGTEVHAQTQGWECIPGVIRNDGQDSFRLEVRLNRSVSQVTLQNLSPRLTVSVSTPVILRDDGNGSDQVAGDLVFTTGAIRYNASQPLPSFLYGDSTSPSGLDLLSIGEIEIVELGGGLTHFLVPPTVGLLRSDIPLVNVHTLNADFCATPSLLNLRTTTWESQRFLRGLAGDVRRLTNSAYAFLPDNVDFFIMLSMERLEQIPATSFQNFNTGSHVSAKVNYTGTGLTPFNDTATFGSGGALLGTVVLDAGDRGLYSSNLTHELMHQWGAYVDPSLGLTDSDGHYTPRSSVGSLLGGQAWPQQPDGSFVLDCNEGRNGAHSASALDLYMMGLLDAAQVPPIRIYSDTSPPPLLRCGNVITDVVRMVTIADLRKLLGIRLPAPSTAKRHFNVAFLAESHNRLLTPTEMTFYELLAAHFVKALPPSDPNPYVGFNWAPISRFFGNGVTWNSAIHLADFNGDGRVDQADVAHMRLCRSGPAVAQTNPLCQDADLDFDGDVDQDDFGLLQTKIK